MKFHLISHKLQIIQELRKIHLKQKMRWLFFLMKRKLSLSEFSIFFHLQSGKCLNHAVVDDVDRYEISYFHSISLKLSEKGERN